MGSTYTKDEGIVLYFQLEILNESLKKILTSEAEITEVSINAVKKLRGDVVRQSEGPMIKSIPEVTDSSTSADLFIIVSLLFATIQAILPEREIKSIISKGAELVGTAAKAKQMISE